MAGVKLNIASQNGLISDCQADIDYPKISVILQNQTVDTIRQRLNLIYKQCGQAHQFAFFKAQGLTASNQQQLAQSQALALEQIQEISWQLWRIYQQGIEPQSITEPKLLSELGMQIQMLAVRWRQKLMNYKSQLAAELWLEQEITLAQDVSDSLASQNLKREELVLIIDDAEQDFIDQQLQQWQQSLYQPLIEHLQQQSILQQLKTSNETLAQYESGPSVWLNQQNPTLIDRIEGLWQQLLKAKDAFVTPSLDFYNLLNRTQGGVFAARGQLTHTVSWQQDIAVQYQIQVPTVGIIHSICQSLIGYPTELFSADIDKLQLWILTHFPCMEVDVQFKN